MKELKIFRGQSNSWVMLLFFAGLVACGDEPQQEPVEQEETTEETATQDSETVELWDYENTNWEQIGNNQCSSAVQSPVNIDTDEVIPAQLSEIEYEYEPFEMSIVDNGHTIQVQGTENSFITVEGKRYQFMQFHFHSPAEHTIDGERLPLEMHLVHLEEGTENLVVLGILIEEGTTENSFLEKVFSEIPEEKEEMKSTDVQLNLSDYIPPAQTHYTYVGSLTTPPCTVGVDWIVFEEPITASSEQLEEFSQVYDDNSRPVQPLDNRRVLKSME